MIRAIAMALRQIRYENRSFWRNPTAAFFTIVMPLMFLVILNAILGKDQGQLEGGQANLSNFYVPAMAALSVVNSCYTSIAMSVAIARDEGVLKRVRGTPLPGWAYLFGRLAHSTLLAMFLVAIVVGFGAAFYGVDLPQRTLPAFILSIAVGAAAFSALGMALVCFIPNAEAAPAIANGTMLPIFFISNVFIHLHDPPDWLDAAGRFFPVRHFSEACQTAFNPFYTGKGYEWNDLAIVGLWGLVGALIALRFFSWRPKV